MVRINFKRIGEVQSYHWVGEENQNICEQPPCKQKELGVPGKRKTGTAFSTKKKIILGPWLSSDECTNKQPLSGQEVA